MKRNLRFLAGAFLLTATALFTGCNSDDDFLMNPQTDSVTPETRANFNDDGTTTITFDDFDETFMAVSPKAENYYRLSGNFWLLSFKISYLCLPLFYETRTTPSCHPSGCAYRQL